MKKIIFTTLFSILLIGTVHAKTTYETVDSNGDGNIDQLKVSVLTEIENNTVYGKIGIIGQIAKLEKQNTSYEKEVIENEKLIDQNEVTIKDLKSYLKSVNNDVT